MKSVFAALAVALIVALASLYAQGPHAPAPPQRIAMHPPAAVAVPPTHIPQLMLASLENTFDSRLEAMDANDPVDILGGTRGLYVEGFGAVFTTEVSLIVTPGIFPMHFTITDEQKLKVHQRKLAHLPKLEDVMKQLMEISARALATVPDDQKIIYAVRLRYLRYEDTTGLPAQITMTADKKPAIMGDIKTKVE